MDHRNIRRRLRKLAHKAHSQFPMMNFGGCCVFAAAVASELERHGVKHEVITSGHSYMDLNELRPERNTVEAWNSMGVGFGHVGVRLKLKGQWFTYDSERPLVPGKREFGRTSWDEPWQAARGGLTAAEATELASESNSWNREFYNDRNVKAVRELVAEAFR
jgi:hypothetical protein